MKNFDIASTSALLFTALVTPFEVAFVSGGDHRDALFWCNRLIDLVFTTDMIQVRRRSGRALPSGLSPRFLRPCKPPSSPPEVVEPTRNAHLLPSNGNLDERL